MKFISWNIAGVNKRQSEIEELMRVHLPDILCLQKTRSKDAPEIAGYRCFSDCSDRWSGVTTYYRNDLSVILIESDTHHIILEFDGFILINAYAPYSNAKVPGYIELRKKWDKWIVGFVQKQVKPVIICGDLNIVHTELDTFQNSYIRNCGCYYKWERDDFNLLLNDGRMIDTFRLLHPYERVYTYFDTMHGIDYRALNQGTRLDYFLISELLKSKLVNSEIMSDFGTAPSVPISLRMN